MASSSPIATSLLLLLLLISSSVAIRPSPDLFNKPTSSRVSALLRSFSRAPTPPNSRHHRCSNGRIDVAMTLDFNSLRGLVSSVGSILSHSSCPYNLRFHFLISSDDDDNNNDDYRALLGFIFPRLSFHISTFEQKAVQTLVERKLARDSQLSYARGYLADVLPPSVDRVIYLDPNVIVLDDILSLWNTGFRRNSSVVAAPRYCVARKRCYFKTGVMVVDLGRWREGGYSERVEELMVRMQKGEWIYDPMEAAFRGAAEGVDERWDRIESDLDGDCKLVYGEGEVSLVHWSAVKPWERFHGEGCEVKLWAQYDLYRSEPSARLRFLL